MSNILSVYIWVHAMIYGFFVEAETHFIFVTEKITETITVHLKNLFSSLYERKI